MNILAIDTSLGACSAALLRRDGAGERLFRRFEAMERGHAEAIFPMIAAVMAEAGVAFADLTRIAVTPGPGTFTGVRAGIAAARGLALAAGLPIAVAGSLEVMALGCLRDTAEAERAGGFMIAHDARRDEFYCQSFDADGGALCAPAIMSVAEAVENLGAISLVAGSGALALAGEAARSGRNLHAVLPALLPDAADLARLALNLPHCAQSPAPLYLRAPDAKPQSDKIFARV